MYVLWSNLGKLLFRKNATKYLLLCLGRSFLASLSSIKTGLQHRAETILRLIPGEQNDLMATVKEPLLAYV
jgi:hypothetical protein